MTTPSRSTLESDLERHQHNGDFAAQAATLMALADMVKTDDVRISYSLAQGLYGQAWEAYENAGDKWGIARAARAVADVMSEHLWHADNLSYSTEIMVEGGWSGDNLNYPSVEFSRLEINKIYELALTLSIEAGDAQGQAEIYVILDTNARMMEDS